MSFDANTALSTLTQSLQGLLASHSQASRLLRIHTPLDSDKLLVERFEGEDRVNDGGFRFEATLLSTDASIKLKSLLGQPILIELLTQQSHTDYRPFHGHVTGAELLGSDGGLARYKLVIEPWLSFLKQRRDSWIFQDQSCVEIIDELLTGWSGQGKLLPAWRWVLADDSIYHRRSLSSQYNETDFAFFERLLADEGLFYWFEHTGEASEEPFGSHTLVIADQASAWGSGAQPVVRYAQAGSVLPEDAIQRVVTRRTLDTQAIELSSWDYRTLDQRPASAQGSAPGDFDLTLSRHDTPGAYAWPDADTAQRIASRQLEAIEARGRCLNLAGTLRSAAPGTVITLTGHPRFGTGVASTDPGSPNDGRLALVSVRHRARNNLSADIKAGLASLFEVPSTFSARPKPVEGPGSASATADEPLYQQEAVAIPATLPWRPLLADGRGLRLHAKPTVLGSQTAIVVGDDGQPLSSDRDQRIKVQFHWLRGEKSHSRLAHGSGDDNAPANAASGTWVRVLNPQAGANWGGHFTPRIGQEVVVSFIEGDIDRPVVVGAVYNGRGQDDAQHNRQSGSVGAVTANAPAWFAGGEGGHAHNAVLHGIKTQAMGSSQSGQGGFNQLLFDATPNEARVELSTTQAGSRLQLGRLKHQPDNRRLNDRGHGFELATEAHGALRAGAGLLLSADRRVDARSTQLDAREAQDSLASAQSLTLTLAETAQKQNAKLASDPAAEKLPAHLAAADLRERMAGSVEHGSNVGAEAAASVATRGGEGSAPAWEAPILACSAPAGFAWHTPRDAHFCAQSQISLTAAQAVDINALGEWHTAVKDGLVLFTYGKAQAGNPVQDTGLKLHAASGRASLQSQSDVTTLAADKDVTVASTSASLSASAPNHLLLTAGGAYIKLAGGNIEVHGPGSVTFKAGQKNLSGPASPNSSGAHLAKPGKLDLFNEAFVVRDEETGQCLAHTRYRIEDEHGNLLIQGMTDADGRTQRVHTAKATAIKLFMLDS